MTTITLPRPVSADVTAEAKRTAKAIAEQLQTYFVQQGWIPPSQ